MKFTLLAAVLLMSSSSNGKPLQETSDNVSHEHSHAHEVEDAKPNKLNENKLKSQKQDDHQEGITLSAEKRTIANIQVKSLSKAIYSKRIYAPGEVKANGYTSYIVSPRTESVIISRHAILGEHVKKGQPLVTLFSESMADAQAQYRLAYSEWQRTKKLGKDTISESNLLKSETDYISAYGRLTAFGLTKQAIVDIVADNSSNLGEYTLVAKRSGVVLSDDFSQGQRVSAGEKIMILADEETLWVEAKVSAEKTLSLPVGSMAEIIFANKTYQAKVIQEAHTIDAVTRTRVVRLAVENHDDSLHPGMFVDVHFLFDTPTPVIAVPEAALMRSNDGDWSVFVEEHPGEFKAVEVELGQALAGFREISGIAEHSRVVISGAFFVASEIAKGGFDPHNH